MNIKTHYKSLISYSMYERKHGNRGNGSAHGYMKRMARRELRRNGKQFIAEEHPDNQVDWENCPSYYGGGQ